MPGIDDKRPVVPLKIAVLTVSDTREAADDKSGATLAERIEQAGHAVAGRATLTDAVAALREHNGTGIRAKAHTNTISTGGPRRRRPPRTPPRLPLRSPPPPCRNRGAPPPPKTVLSTRVSSRLPANRRGEPSALDC